jgi:sporulation protein YlmC with PRC-barrel domain
MKRKYQIIISTSAASVMAFTALAQDKTNYPPTDQPGDVRQDNTEVRVDKLNDALKSSDVIGMTVKNYQGETIGTVQDLVVDVEHGRIVQLILSTGEYSGIHGLMTAAPPRAFRHNAADNILELHANREKLKMAPTFEPGTWNEGTQTNREDEVYVYYGGLPSFVSSSNNIPITNSDGWLTRTLLRNETLTNQAEGKEKARKVNGTLVAGDAEKASSLMGMTVNNLQGEKLGKVENLLIDFPTGRIVAVIISTGGFLGMDGELSPIPPTALRFTEVKDMLNRGTESSFRPTDLPHTEDQNGDQLAHSSAASPDNGLVDQNTSDHEILVLDASKKAIGDAPHFKADQWPDFGQPTYVGGVYRAYNVQPFYNTNGIVEPVKITSNQ